MPKSLKRSKLIATVLFALFACLPGHAPAQGSGSTVVYVGGNDLVLKSADGRLLNYTIPSDYRFPAGGRKLSLAELKPGTQLAQPVVTSSDPVPVASVRVVKGKVYAATPPDSVSLLLAEGVTELTAPTGTVFAVNGKELSLAQLKPDMMVEATVVTMGAASPDAPAGPPATPPMVGALLLANVAPTGPELPMSGTNQPLYGVLGLSLLALGAGVLLFRRPTRTIG